jgi:hypothetical protein
MVSFERARTLPPRLTMLPRPVLCGFWAWRAMLIDLKEAEAIQALRYYGILTHQNLLPMAKTDEYRANFQKRL